MPRSDSAGVDEFEDVALSVRNIGGIEHAEVEFDTGVTIFTGRNATNRTSLLSAIAGVLGGTSASLKSDADEGHVRIDLGGEEYTREYTRTPNGVRVEGNPYTDDETLVDLFVTLLEDNPVRRAVERGDELREIIMRPVDTDAIEERIASLRAERESIEAELETVERRRGELPALEEQRQSLEAAIEEIDEELATLREEADAVEADVEDAEAAADVIDELNERRQRLSDARDRLEVKRAELDALRDDREGLEADLEELPEEPSTDREALEGELASARERKRALDDTIASLTTIVEFNEDLLSEGIDLPGVEADSEAVTAELAPDEEREIVCWTCGSHVRRGAIDERLDDLRAVIGDKRDERRDLEDRIEELDSRIEEFERIRSREADLETRLDDTTEKIATLEEEIDDLDAEIAALEEEIGDLEERAARTEELRETDLIETYERISDLQYERGQREQQLEDVTDEIREIESLPERESLEAQREEIETELRNERARIDDLEAAAVEAFNEHMDDLLAVLEYENLARVWIERKTRDGSDTVFDLHVVRESAGGAGYEDEVSNLSESEREVVGLVVALAGYLVHEVYERVPFMLLDSVEAIDAQRIAAVVEYFASYAPCFVVALLPEDAAALADSYERISGTALSG